MITAGLEERLAERMNATTITLPTCHLAMLQEPLRVAEFIVQAAGKPLLIQVLEGFSWLRESRAFNAMIHVR